MKRIFTLILVLVCFVALFILNGCKEKGGDDTGNSENIQNGGGADDAHVHSFTVESAEDAYLKKEASCLGKAVYYKSCSCGKTGEETFEYGEIGAHVYDIQNAESKYILEEATCSSPSLYKYSCICGEAGTETFAFGETIEHSYEGYVCSECSYEKSSEGLILSYDDRYDIWEVVGFDESITADVHIASHNGNKISSIANGAFKNCKTIKTLYVADHITRIGEEAFYGCENLESIYLGEKLISLGQRAFMLCSALSEIAVSDNNEIFFDAGNCLIENRDVTYVDGTVENLNGLVVGCKESVIPLDKDVKVIDSHAFYGVKGLSSAVIPDSVKEVGSSAFEGCTDLKHITIGKSVTFIGEGAFANCRYLETIDFNAVDLTGFGEDTTFSNTGVDTAGITLTIGKLVEKIPGEFFGNNIHHTDDDAFVSLKLKSLIFAQDSVVSSIGANAFYNSGYLQSVSLPASVREVGEHAFAECDGLVSVVMTDSPIELKYECFKDCHSLSSLKLGANTVIAPQAFMNAYLLTELVIPEGITSIGTGAFNNCSSLTTLSISKTVKEFSGFANCYSLETIYYNAADVSDFLAKGLFVNAGIHTFGITLTVGKDVKRIPAHMFDSLSVNLSIVNFEEGSVCKSIGEYAFGGCSNLVRVTLPEGLEDVESGAFYNCSSLVEVYNLSNLEFDYNHQSGLGQYALYFHDSMESETKLVFVDNYFVFFKNGDERVLAAYTGSETDLTLPSSFENGTYKINKYAFYLSSVVNVVIPKCVTEIGFSAFQTSKLETAVLANGVTAIRECAFDCPYLKKIIVPKSVTIVESNAFGGKAEIFCELEAQPDSWPDYHGTDMAAYSFYNADSTVYWYSENERSGNYWRYVNGEPTVW